MLFQAPPFQWMMELPPTAHTSSAAFPHTPSKDPLGEGGWAHPPSGRTKMASASSPASTGGVASGEPASGNPVSGAPASDALAASDDGKASDAESVCPPASNDVATSDTAPASLLTASDAGMASVAPS